MAENAIYYRGGGNIIAHNINTIKNTIHDTVYTHTNGVKNNLLNWESKRGIEWLIVKISDNYYTIQNRANGCFLNSSTKGKVDWAQINNGENSNNTSTLWEIIKA